MARPIPESELEAITAAVAVHPPAKVEKIHRCPDNPRRALVDAVEDEGFEAR